MKRALSLLRYLSPSGWLLVLAVGTVVFLVLSLTTPSVLGLTFDPFGLKNRKIERLTEERDFAASDAAARGLEVEGAREQAARLDHHFRQELVITDLTARAEAAARIAPDANTPLDGGRADRLRAYDGELCNVRPALCAASTARSAGGVGGELQSAGSAVLPD